jgi:TonB family protein
MTIKLRFAWGEAADPILMKMAGWSAAAHVVGLIVFSVLPRFGAPERGPRATIAEIVPASALFPAAPRGGAPRAADTGPTPSQRAEAAREAARPKAPPPLKPPGARKAEPEKLSMKKSVPAAPRPARDEKPEAPQAPDAGAAREDRFEDDHPTGDAGENHGISFGGAVGPGGIPSIGSSAFPYDYYRTSLAAVLQSNWRRPVAPEGLKQTIACRIQFTILKSGIVQDPRIVQPSGNDALDQSALRAVYNSNPLPPLPFQYGQASVSAEVVFELTPD